MIFSQKSACFYHHGMISTVVFLIFWFSVVESLCTDNCRFGKDYCKPDGSDCLYGCYDGYLGQGCQQQCGILHCRSCYLTGDIYTKEVCSTCKSGHYGNNCEHLCSTHCVNRKCDRQGNCLYGCKSGWIGEQCDKQNCTYANCKKCSNNPYSNYCSVCDIGMFWNPFYGECRNCSSHCIGGAVACNTTTGVCSACEDKWYGSNCDKHCDIDNCSKCKDVYHGVTKYKECDICDQGWFIENRVCKRCSEFCLGGNNTCDRRNGHCLNGCVMGKFGSRCNMTCFFSNCVKCDLKPQGINLVKYCSLCKTGYYWNFDTNSCEECSVNCKSGCNMTNGNCLGGCVDGFYGRDCKTPCGQCANSTCDSTYGHCYGGCEENWYGLWCNSNCPVQCSSCSGFKNGVCDGCEAGWYGPVCEQKCSPTCQRSNFNNFLYCHKETGVCTYGCISGRSGPYCNVTCSPNCLANVCDITTGKCSYGCNINHYGEKCDKKCAANCKSGCHQADGKCISCKFGFYGIYCEHECNKNCLNGYCDRSLNGICRTGCKNGFYGSNCSNDCNEHCLNRTCYQGSGSCMYGCVIGYFGSHCKVPCPANCLHGCNRDSGFCIGCLYGYYGDRCTEICGNYCHNKSCDQDTARCTEGCIEGKRGVNCLEDCKDGFYGRNCLDTCGSCKEGTVCYHSNGSCPDGCMFGWSDSTCKSKGPSLRLHKSDDSDKSTIAISSSATVGVLLTVTVLTIGALCYRRQKGLPLCTMISTKKSEDGPEPRTLTNQASHCTFSALRDVSQQLLIDPSDLQIKDTICQGHFCIVKTALLLQKKTESAVIVKILSKESHSSWRSEFFHEVEILKSLKHHVNILTLIGICENDSCLHSIFEPCGSGNLKMYLQNLKKSSSDSPAEIVAVCYVELVSFIVNVLDALLYLEQNQIIHRHVAARNVYLDANYTAKLTNFNFALKCTPDELEAGFVKARKLPSSLMLWMPPEAVQNNTYSHQTDVWGVGMLLWETVTLGFGNQPRQIFDFKFRQPKTLSANPDGRGDHSESRSPNRDLKGGPNYSPNKDCTQRYLSDRSPAKTDEVRGLEAAGGPFEHQTVTHRRPADKSATNSASNKQNISPSRSPHHSQNTAGMESSACRDRRNSNNNERYSTVVERNGTNYTTKLADDAENSRIGDVDGSSPSYKHYNNNPDVRLRLPNDKNSPDSKLHQPSDRSRSGLHQPSDRNSTDRRLHQPSDRNSTDRRLHLPSDRSSPGSKLRLPSDRSSSDSKLRLPSDRSSPDSGLQLPSDRSSPDSRLRLPSDRSSPDSRLRLPSDRLSPVPHPSIPDACDKVIGRCIQLCWNEDPKRRPTFEHLKYRLSKALKDRQDSTGELVLTVSSMV